MDFDLNEEQRLLKESVDRLVEQRYSFEQRKKYLAEPGGWSRAQWKQYAEMGLLGLPFEEKYGGIGSGPVEMMIVMEAFGRGLVLEPYFATVVLAGSALRLAGSDAQKQAHLPGIAAGERLMALAHAEVQSRHDLADVKARAEKDGAGWVLNGAKTLVLHGDCAEWLVVAARVTGEQRDRQGIALFLVDANAAGIARKGYSLQDGSRAADIVLSNVRVGADATLGKPGEGHAVLERVIESGIAALCAEAVGAMEEMHAVTLDYLKTREQFGVKIGSFQVLQHRSVDMLVALEQARSMSYLATMSVDEPDAAERRKTISAAKVQVGRSTRYVGQQAIQLHGGIGVTMEYKVGHYFMRTTAIELLYGDADHHLTQVARAGGFVPARA